MSDDALLAGRYRRIRALGRGAMGEVWLAEDTELGRQVAIKSVRFSAEYGEDADAFERMVREARVAARLHHRHAVTVFDLIRADGQPHVIMEYVDGETLADRLARVGRLELGEAARLISQVAEALDAAHQLGIVHRDVKPGNILIDKVGEAKLADFGIARGLGDAVLTGTGQMVGTVAYMAPEVARDGVATTASDIWSLGATLYAAVEGRAPYQADSSSGAVQILTRLASEPVPPPTRAGRLEPVIMAMLRADPTLRPSAADVREQLAASGGRDSSDVTLRRPTAQPVTTTLQPEVSAHSQTVLPASPPPMESTTLRRAVTEANQASAPGMREGIAHRRNWLLTAALVALPLVCFLAFILGMFGALGWIYLSMGAGVAWLGLITVSRRSRATASPTSRGRRPGRLAFTAGAAMIGLVATGVLAAVIDARSKWYLADDDGYVSVYHGERGRTVGFSTSRLSARTDLPTSYVTGSDRIFLQSGDLAGHAQVLEQLATIREDACAAWAAGNLGTQSPNQDNGSHSKRGLTSPSWCTASP